MENNSNEHTKNILDLSKIIKTNGIISKFIEEWNNVKLSEFEKMAYGETFKDIFKNEKTQEKTKEISPWLYRILQHLLKEICPDFIVDKKDKRDYKYIITSIEAKITFSDSNSWTGNGTKKTPWHLLFKFKLNDDGKIIGCFAMFANINECMCKWTDPKKSKKGEPVNYSSLKFMNKCKDNLHILHGDLEIKEKQIPIKMMKEFAKDNSINIDKKCKKKDEIKTFIESKLDELSIREKWNELYYNPDGILEYILK